MAEHPPGVGSEFEDNRDPVGEDDLLDSEGDSAGSDSTGEAGSDESYTDSEASIDPALEYQKEMEEQRLADEKNGHLLEDCCPSLPRVHRKITSEVSERGTSVAAHDSVFTPRVSAVRVSSKRGVNLDGKVVEGEKFLNEINSQENLLKDSGGYETAPLTAHHDVNGVDLSRLERAQARGQIVVDRGNNEWGCAEIFGNPTFESSHPHSLSSIHADSPLFSENNAMHLHGKSYPVGMEMGHGDGSMGPVLVVRPISMYQAEDEAQMDLQEAQPLAQRQFFSTSPSKLSNPSLVSAQINPLPSHTPKHSQPTFNQPPMSPNPETQIIPFVSQANTQPLLSLNRPPLPKIPRPKTNLNHPKPFTPSPQKISKPNTFTRLHASAEKELTAALFKNKPQSASHSTSSPRQNSSQELHAAAIPMEADFPPFFAKPLPSPSPHAASSSSAHPQVFMTDLTGIEDEDTDFQPPQLEGQHLSNGQRAIKWGKRALGDSENSTGRPSWADMADMEHRVPPMNADHSLPREEGTADQQPKIFFGRSMADVLKSGQPAEGPILLDHAHAEKCGEVRLVEGKPCLFFSANESADLAGRLGPAIVGKFSHSIPTAHQIQKALGNLKLVGAMSWNFLNAKHVFIQLSDMRDYVKLLSGPNNSPVWYIEHHPMRVFKWTLDFDPFFEIPVVAIWCNILALPVHLFEESALIAIGNLLGHAVQVDRATITRSRVSFARLCVEVDISRPIPEEISLDIAGKRVTLKVKWDKIPMYCGACKHVGHTAENCYAFGKRPMPPKKDYSHGAPGQPRTTPQGERGQHPEGWASNAQPGASRQAQNPEGRPHVRQDPERAHREDRQPQRPEVRTQETAYGMRATGYTYDSTPPATAKEATQATEDDAFIVPKKKKKTKSAASRARQRERRKMKRQLQPSSAAVESEGGGDDSDGVHSSSDSDRSTRSASSSHRHQHVGPLAMVVSKNNMFGALEDFPSEDEGRHTSRTHDTRMVEASSSRTRQFESEEHGPGYTSPPPEGQLKKARLSASGTH